MQYEERVGFFEKEYFRKETEILFLYLTIRSLP